MAAIMASVTKRLKAAQKMKLLISLVARPEYALLFLLMAHAGAVLAQTPQQHAWNIMRAGAHEKSTGKRTAAVRALRLLPGDTEATEMARTDGKNTMVWTNDDLERLHGLALISIVGRSDEKSSTPAGSSDPRMGTQDPQWYELQAAKLRDELERRQTQLRQYQEAIRDVQNLGTTTGGVNLDEGDLAITPQVGIEILERHVKEAQAEINDLEDLARRHDIPPGALRSE